MAERVSPPRGAGIGPVPPPAPRAMPDQSLSAGPRAPRAHPGPRVAAARLVTFGGAALIGALGTWQMAKVFGPDQATALQILLNGVFALAFGWIALAATTALAGLCFAPARQRPGEAPIAGRTAIVMPVYNEDAAATAAALAAMGEGLAEAGHGADYEIFILSDTRDPDAWARETAAFAALRARLAGRMAVWYRRRPANEGRKAGNLRDFVERWGARYDYLLSLDADSLMTPRTILAMTRRMEADPALGLLQSPPALIDDATPFARLQSFAGALYGPVVARGVAAWQGLDGNYWGHNAILRLDAFAQAGGLPRLPGRPPFGGPVLSHDFVEAALLRRAGWRVRMDPDLQGSYEGCPPSLAAAAARDRRWAQGNLQHVKVIGAAGLAWPNRAHMAIGIASYLASPIWLLLLGLGIVLTAQIVLGQPDYFPRAHQLFPVWPRFDAERMAWLFAASLGLLAVPKLIGLAEALARPGRARAFGGHGRLLAGAGAEIVLSALYAPVMMLIQTRQLGEILAGRDSGWSAQARAGAKLAWREAFARHWTHLAVGLALAVAAAYAALPLVPWLSPILAGLILAPLLARISADPEIGRRLDRLGLMALPREPERASIEAARRRARVALEAAARIDFATLLADPEARRTHALSLGEADRAAAERLALITARAKVAAAASPQEALAWLDAAEKTALMARPELMERDRAPDRVVARVVAAGGA